MRSPRQTTESVNSGERIRVKRQTLKGLKGLNGLNGRVFEVGFRHIFLQTLKDFGSRTLIGSVFPRDDL